MTHKRRFPKDQTLALAVVVCLVIAPSPGLASSIFHHEAMCEKALGELGWDETSTRQVAKANAATDIGRLPEHSRMIVDVLLPATGRQVPTVRSLAATAPFSPQGSSGFHFNSLYSFHAIGERWTDLELWVDEVVERLRAEPRQSTRHEYEVFLGMVTHMIQDFYCHSNWVGLLDGFTERDLEPDEFPLWEELVLNEGGWRENNPGFSWQTAFHRLRLSNTVVRECEHLGGLQTGSVRWEEFTGMRPWGHRHATGEERAVVHALAIRATRFWVQRIEEKMHEAVATPPEDLVQGDLDRSPSEGQAPPTSAPTR